LDEKLSGIFALDFLCGDAIPTKMSEMTEIVDCSSKTQLGWGTDPKQTYMFKTVTGINVGCHFLCRAEQIPEQIRKAVDAGGTVKAEVGTEPDLQQLISFRRFVV
jgi:hypothetical protein